MKRTEDGYIVLEHEYVFEVMWEYINPELSKAYPSIGLVSKIPDKVKVWKHEYICRLHCMKLNEIKHTAPSTKHPIPVVMLSGES